MKRPQTQAMGSMNASCQKMRRRTSKMITTKTIHGNVGGDGGVWAYLG